MTILRYYDGLLEAEVRDDSLLLLAHPRVDLQIPLETAPFQLVAEKLIELEEPGGVGQLDGHADRLRASLVSADPFRPEADRTGRGHAGNTEHGPRPPHPLGAGADQREGARDVRDNFSPRT